MFNDSYITILFLLPFLILSLFNTALVFFRATQLNDIRHASFKKRLFVLIAMTLVGLGLALVAFFTFYNTSFFDSYSSYFIVSAVYMPLQGLAQKMVLSSLLKPKPIQGPAWVFSGTSIMIGVVAVVIYLGLDNTWFIYVAPPLAVMVALFAYLYHQDKNSKR